MLRRSSELLVRKLQGTEPRPSRYTVRLRYCKADSKSLPATALCPSLENALERNTDVVNGMAMEKEFGGKWVPQGTGKVPEEMPVTAEDKSVCRVSDVGEAVI